MLTADLTENLGRANSQYYFTDLLWMPVVSSRTPLTAQEMRATFGQCSDIEIFRIHYCYEIGSTLVCMALMEDAIIEAMAVCEKIVVQRKLGSDSEKWQEMLEKRSHLKESTLGNLLRILSRHGVSSQDLNYLNWVKSKRDYFVHEFVHRGAWPGDLGSEAINALCRQLRFLQLVFQRANQRIWKIFGQASLLVYHDLGSAGALLFNDSMFGEISERQGRTRGSE